MVELWQANAAGRYRHPADDREDLPLEDGFLGFGRAGTHDDGRFELVTVKPGRVPWPGGGLQAPHALVAVFARGLLKHVVTRLYFPDEVEANAEDPVLSSLEDDEPPGVQGAAMLGSGAGASEGFGASRPDSIEARPELAAGRPLAPPRSPGAPR